MKNKMFMAFMLMMVVSLSAFSQKNDKDDSRYLAGAVPVVNGSVVFSKTYVINGMSKDEVYEKMLSYLNDRMAKNENALSRVAYANKEEGSLVALGDEWMVFRSSALSLDRTKINYQVRVECFDAKCNVAITKIRYTYQEKDKYEAETWITDKYALSKKKGTLVRGIAKWRRKTVDFADTYFTEIRDLFAGKVVEKPKPQPQEVTTKSSGPVVIETKKQEAAVATAPVSVPATTVTPVQTPVAKGKLHTVSPQDVPSSAMSLIKNAKAVVMIGSGDDMTTMTAKKGASLGYNNDKAVVFTFFDGSQNTSILEGVDSYTVKFVDLSTNETVMILKCKAQKKQSKKNSFTGEIVKAEAIN